MKQITTEIFIEVEETLVVRSIEPKTKSGGYPPGTQTICGHCGQIIRDPQVLNNGDGSLKAS
ncbi:MAG: hypothetical protein ABIP75_08965 [Pyrinomonadaceae bacterium]